MDAFRYYCADYHQLHIGPDKNFIRVIVRKPDHVTNIINIIILAMLSTLEADEMTDLIKQITGDLQRQIESFEPQYEISDIGKVLEAGDGIARVEGLEKVRAQELVQFSNGVMGTGFQP